MRSIIILKMNHCSFCIEPSIINCMNRSLYNKHCDDEDKSGQIIDILIHHDQNPAYSKYSQVILESDQRQFMNIYLKGRMLTRQYCELLQYYKYRFFVPVFTKSKTTDTVLTYYYDKLKHYYNGIKRQLNITVQNSSSSSTSYLSQSQTNFSTKQEVLKDLRKQLEAEKKKEKKKKKLSSIVQYKTQSKALEEMVCYMKLNPKFQQIKTLKTEDCFQEQSIFKETVQNKNIFKEEVSHHESTKTAIKSKLFKRFIEGALTNRQIPTYQAQKVRQRPTSRSKSIKVIKFKQSKEQNRSNKGQIIKPLQPRVRESGSLKTLPKRNISLGKINQNNHYSSPYQKKSSSTEKGKAVTTFLTKTGRSSSTDHLKLNTIDTRTRTKDSVVTTNIIKFQNTMAFKSTPSSPSHRKMSKPEVKVSKNDNILTIRKKKLQALKEKVARK